MKRKSLTMILCLLTCLSLVGVGFAAWVITAPAEATATGNIEVDTVTDSRLVVEATLANSEKGSIVFAPVANTTDGWLEVAADSKSENLIVTYNCKVTKKSGTFTNENDISVSALLTEPSESNSNYKNAKDAKCFTLANENGYKISSLTINEGKSVISFTISVEYKWGEIFGEVNPTNYYNAKNGSNFARPVNGLCGAKEGTTLTDKSNWGDHAYYYLDLLQKVGNDLKFNLTISVDYNSTDA